jgi:hypothetical protein
MQNIDFENDVMHWVLIVAKNERREVVEVLRWDCMKYGLRLKWDWYFRYRAALMQVKYPKFEIQYRWGNEPATGKTLSGIIKDKIAAKRAQITKFKNKLSAYAERRKSLFPVEDEIPYKSALEKIRKKEIELEELIQKQNLIENETTKHTTSRHPSTGA